MESLVPPPELCFRLSDSQRAESFFRSCIMADVRFLYAVMW